MSNIRQAPPSPAVRAYAVTHPSGAVVIPQPAGWDQLLYASRGVMTVYTGAGTWVVPPHRAVWVPSGIDHRILMSGRVAVRSLYFLEGLVSLPAECRAVNVPPLLRELILHAAAEAPLYQERPEHLRLIEVILDQLAALPVAPLQLPLPRDARALLVATQMISDCGSPDSLDVICRKSGAHLRTIERLFLAQTGMTLDRWRRRLRIVEALRLLAAGQKVTSVATAVGYSTPSAFAAMFKQETGTSPARYFSP
jgi:AraC-like DNA-binding protein